VVVERYGYLEEFEPSQEVVEFFLWLHTYIDEENLTPEMHFQIIEHVFKKEKKLGVECHRGAAKTTLVDIYMFIYIIFIGYKPGLGVTKKLSEVDFILLLRDQASACAATFEQIISIIKENEKLNKVLSVTKSKLGNDPTVYIYNKTLNKTIYLRGRGIGQKMRGIQILGKRPNLVVFDDIEDDESVESKDVREKLKRWFYQTVLPAINPNRYQFIFIGTPLHQDSLLLNIERNSEWHVIKLPVAEKLDRDMILNGDDIISSWPDRFTKEYIKEIYMEYVNNDDLSETMFFQEHMLIVTPEEDLLFNQDKVKEFSYKELKANDKLDEFRFYLVGDLATGEKDKGDFTSLAVIGVNNNGDWFLVDGAYGKFKILETIERIFKFVVEYRPEEVILEKVGFQTVMKTLVEERMVKTNIYFNLNLIPRMTSKLSVFKGFSTVVNSGKFWIPNDHINEFVSELLNEMSFITEDAILAKKDDVLDSVASLTLTTVGITPIVSRKGRSKRKFSNPSIF
jgi:hypothetical protein